MEIIKKTTFDELEAIHQIAKGKSVKEYDNPTMLMIIAAIRVSKDGWKDVPDGRWNRRIARMSVAQDFEAINYVPEQYRVHCVAEFISHAGKLTRTTIDRYIQIFNQMDDTFIKKCVNRSDTMIRFLSVEHNNFKIHAKQQQQTPRESRPEMSHFSNLEECRYDYSADKDLSCDDNDAVTFLALPLECKTKDRLFQILGTEMDFPSDFVKRLILPNRNAKFYADRGETEKSESWEKRIIPYLNQDICFQIAAAHPEGSIATPQFLTPDNVRAFWGKRRQDRTAAELTKYFMEFPENVLSPEMTEDIVINLSVLQHAPMLLCNSEPARLYLNRYPADILRLPECYQTPARILNDRVPITDRTVEYIKDVAFREKVIAAFGLESNAA